jgi:hypothetical protein
MQKTTALILALLLGLGGAPAFAPDGTSASYASGTVDGLQPETKGTLVTVRASALEFHAGASQFSIPYAQITSFQYKEESKLHVGVLVTIAVGLFAPWEKLDRISIIWDDDRGTTEVATLVLSKQNGEGLLSILEARAVQACGGKGSARCGQRIW